jgi:hypothetical protein
MLHLQEEKLLQDVLRSKRDKFRIEIRRERTNLLFQETRTRTMTNTKKPPNPYDPVTDFAVE